jgi:hypothetical protein
MPEFQQPDIVGNYLQSYYGAQDRVQQQADAQYQKQRQMTLDERQGKQFDQQQQIGALTLAKAKHDNLVNILGRTTDEASFQQGLRQATLPVEQGGLGLSPDQLAGMSFAKDYQRLKNEAGVTAQELDLKLKEAGIAAQNANTAQSYAAAREADAKANAALAKPGGLGGIDNQTFDNMSGLRKEFVGQTKDYQSVRDAYGRIKASAQNPSAAGDLSLIFNYMKVLDPGSTVREGEFATAQNAAGIPERIVNAYNQAISGERLNDTQRKDFVDRAGALFQRQHQTYLATKNNYDTLAKRFNFDPSLITMDQSAGLAEQPAGPPTPQPMTWGGAAPAGLGGTQAAPAAAGNVFDEADRILGIKK